MKNRALKSAGLLLVLGLFVCSVFLHDTSATNAFCEENISADELIKKAWDAQGKAEYEKVFDFTQQCIDLYKEEADRQHSVLGDYPTAEIKPLSEVAVAFFLRAEAVMRQADALAQDDWDETVKLYKDAIDKFQYVITNYRFAVAFDPSRGVFWKVAGVSQESIDKLHEKIKGQIEGSERKGIDLGVKSSITLFDEGTEEIVDYEKYGKFLKVGTKNYRYVIKDQAGLSEAAGEGIFPNTRSVRKDPLYVQMLKEKRLEGSHWDFVNKLDLQAGFLKWATAPEPNGVRLFYTGLMLERSGLISHAIKCYYSIVVHFPESYGWTYWHTPWYVAQAAVSKIHFLLRRNPQLGYKLEGADIRIINGFDNDVSNDTVITNPGRFVKVPSTQNASSVRAGRVKRTLGKGRVQLVQYKNDDWQLMVDGKPFVVRGVTYSPTKIGQSPDFGTLGNWMEEDFNKNSKIDGPYDAFVDANANNIQDPEELAVGDFKLMKEMGINAVRIYHFPNKPNKELLRDLYDTYGIMVIMGDFLGKYALGSKAQWNPGTDYNNPEHKKNMLESVIGMVEEYKDEPYILCWLLGNENVYGVACNADKDPEAFFKFANEVALKIKSVDPDHPVAVCSGDVLFLDRFGKYAPDIDIFGANAYRGDYGFGFLWRQVKRQADKPVFITEFGCPAYAEGRSAEEGEYLQSEYHRGAWEDIEFNMINSAGEGNSIGGIIFEWLDEWWKAYEPRLHDRKGFFTGPFPDGYMHEEWLGLCGQGNGKSSPFLRNLRQVYYMYQQKWNKEPCVDKK